MNHAQIAALQQMVQRNPSIIWYTTSYDTLNAEALTEALYNYGSWDDITAYHQLVGLSEAHSLFTNLSQKSRSNLRPIVRNFFSLYYDRHPS